MTVDDRSEHLTKDLEDANFRLNRKLAQMETLHEAGLSLGSSLNVQDVIEEFLRNAVAVVDASSGFLFLKHEKTGRFELTAHANLSENQQSLLMDNAFRQHMQRVIKKRSVMTLDAGDLPQGFSGRHVLVAPAPPVGFIGVIDKESRQGVEPFEAEDGQLLGLMGQQAGMALANARLYRQMAEEKNLALNIFESVANGVISVDLNGTILRVNHALKRIFAHETVFLGKSCVQLFKRLGCMNIAQAILFSLEDGHARTVTDDEPQISDGRSTVNVHAKITPLQGQTEGLVVALEDLTEQTRVRTMFKQYASDQVVELLLKDGSAPALGGQTLEATMLFMDIAGYTELLGRIGSEEMVRLMNDCYTRMVDIVFKHNGTLDKYTGDGFFVVFGAPLSMDDDSHRAVQCALEIVQELDQFNRVHKLSFGVRLGISRGTVVAGNIGSPRRMEYSVIGPDVNLAQRLCDQALAGEILISEQVCTQIDGQFELASIGRLRFKGIREPLDVHQVLGPRGAHLLEERAQRKDVKEGVTIDLSIPMEPSMELTVSKTAESVAEFMGLDPDKTEEVKLAMVEACINAFEHSQSKDQRLQVDFSIGDKELTVLISDRGHGFDVSSALAKVRKRHTGGELRRGWGLELIGTFMDEVDIESGRDGTTLTLVKYR